MKIAPYHPQSNGLAERFVDSTKRALKKLTPEGRNIAQHLSIFLQTHLSTPNPITHQSPFELMFSRKMVTPLNAMLPIPERITIRNTAQNEAYDRKHGARKRSFKQNDCVFIQIHHGNKSGWEKGSVVEAIGSKMYIVCTGYHKLHRVHVNQMRPDRS